MTTFSALPHKVNLIRSIQAIFEEGRIEQLAREVKFVQRERTLGGFDFLLMCLFSALPTVGASLEGLCGDLLERGRYIAKQSLHERFNDHAVAFMERVFGEALSQKLGIGAVGHHTFHRIVIGDSTQEELPA